MRLVVAIIFLVAACGGTAESPSETTGTPTAVSTASAKWAEFSSHTAVSANEISAITAEAAGIDRADADAMDANRLKLQRWAEGEAERLDAHPVAQCYAGTYAPWLKIVTLLLDEGYRSDFAQVKDEMTKVKDSIPASAAACST